MEMHWSDSRKRFSSLWVVTMNAYHQKGFHGSQRITKSTENKIALDCFLVEQFYTLNIPLTTDEW